jgi:L-iditol 2-dehydrogenase
MHGTRLWAKPGLKIEFDEFKVPQPGPGQILVQVSHSQVSAGTEMNFFRTHPPEGPPARVQLGYMAVGRVESIGPGVIGFEPGDRVLTAGYHQSHWLVDLNDSSPHAWYVEKLDDGIRDEEAGFAILGDVALHGVRRGTLQLDESVAVWGVGMIGQLTVQLARLSGAYPVIAVDLSAPRLEQAGVSGATHVIDASKTDASAAIRDLTGGAGAQTQFHCTATPSILQPMMEAAGDRGKIVLSGSAPGKAEIGLQVELLRRELSILGNYELGLTVPHAYWPWTRQRNRHACLRLIRTGELRLRHLMSHVVPHTRAQEMYEMMARGGDDWMGVVFTWL